MSSKIYEDLSDSTLTKTIVDNPDASTNLPLEEPAEVDSNFQSEKPS